MINIIGGAGFIGTRLAKVLNEHGTAFNIFDKALNGNNYCDVTQPDTLAAIPTADMIINLAAEHRDDVYPRTLYDSVNVDGARNICNYCRDNNIQKIIFTSSVAVYGFAPEGTDEFGELNPFNDYGRSKIEAEAIYKEWLAEDQNQRTLVIIRPTVIFGEQNRGNVYNLFNQIARKRFIMLGSGSNRKSMAYVENVAEFLAFCINLDPGEHIYNYIDKPDLDMNSLVSHCRKVLFGKDNVGVRLPKWTGVIIGYIFDMVALASKRKLPVSSIRVKKFMETTAFNTSIAETGFKPKCDLLEGIERTLKYEFLQNNLGNKVFYTE